MLAARILKSKLFAYLHRYVGPRKVPFDLQQLMDIGDAFRPRKRSLDLVLDPEFHFVQCARNGKICPVASYG